MLLEDPAGLPISDKSVTLQPAFRFQCPVCSRLLFVSGEPRPRLVGCFSCRLAFAVGPPLPEIDYGT